MGKVIVFLLALHMSVGPTFAATEAPPVEFGLEEIRQAVQERGLGKNSIRIRTEISTAEPESYRITNYRISGGDLRGLMYGLLAAADQVRRHGRLLPERAKPAVPIRGIRRSVQFSELADSWFHSREYWEAYIRMLARNRFNRLNLVFSGQTSNLTLPYPYWVEVEEYPEIRVAGVSATERQRNLDTLCFIAQTAANHAVDFTLGAWQQDTRDWKTPTVNGLTEDNVGPYSYQALKQVLAACPAIRSIQIRPDPRSGIPAERQVEFYRDYVYPALRDTGHLVKVDLGGSHIDETMLSSAIESGVPLRLSSNYWAEHLGRPYQPAEILDGYGYVDLLRRHTPDHEGRPRPYDFFWELWTLGSHRLLLWGDPEYVKRVVPTLMLSDSQGFEIDEPLGQKGFGTQPDNRGVFAKGQEQREFWRWKYERYWLFYLLWGRLSYDPSTPDRVWMDEFKRRFGDASDEVSDAYRCASRVLNEIVAVHMPDPGARMWPEINPGGLIDYYAATPPSDSRMVASIREAVRNRINGIASAKQTPAQTAARLVAMAEQIDAALVGAAEKLPPDHKEWSGTQPDFRVLEWLARFHAHRQLGAERLVEFYETGERSALGAARLEMERALDLWRELVAYTDNLYPPSMVLGPEDFGHWRDKLPYLEHDVRTIREREWLADRFGQFAFGFDFGGEPRELQYLQRIHTSVEPRFFPVHPHVEFSDELGHGWIGQGEREAVALADAPPTTVRASARSVGVLPANALFGDSIRGRGSQTFRVRTGAGEFLVSFLSPDGNVTTQPQTAVNGVIDVRFPEGEWRVSALILQNVRPEMKHAAVSSPEPGPRPAISHTPPHRAVTGRELTLTLRVTPAEAASQVRLHYRPLNARAQFRSMLASADNVTFNIPAEELSVDWDMLYYFEVLGNSGSWFHPDPDVRTPYYVIPVVDLGSASRR